jgi:hypothetical protein
VKRAVWLVLATLCVLPACRRKPDYLYREPAVVVSERWDYDWSPISGWSLIPLHIARIVPYIPGDDGLEADRRITTSRLLLERWYAFEREDTCKPLPDYDPYDECGTPRPPADLGPLTIGGLAIEGWLTVEFERASHQCSYYGEEFQYVHREWDPFTSAVRATSSFLEVLVGDAPEWTAPGPFPATGSLTVSGAGGADAPPFAVEAPSPTPLVLTEPPLVAGENFWVGPAGREWPFHLRWVPGNGEFVLIDYYHSDGSAEGASLLCRSEDDGEFDLPAEWSAWADEAVLAETGNVELARVASSTPVDLGLEDDEGHDRPLRVYDVVAVSIGLAP